MNFWYITLTVWGCFTIIWAIIFFCYAQFWFKKKFVYLESPVIKQNLLYEGFARNDYKEWNFLEFYLTGVFLLPIRLILFSIFLILLYINLKIFSICFYKGPEEPQNLFFFHYSSLIVKIYSRLMMYTMGIYWITEKTIPFDGTKHPDLVPKGNLKDCLLIVSNHVTFLDGLYHVTKGNRCFIGKSQVQNIPFIGTIVGVLQTIFVDRANKQSRLDVIAKLSKRIQRIKNGERFNRVVVFAEGTVSNGEALLDFKNGAFIHDIPLRVIGLKFKSNINVSMAMVDDFSSVLACFCNFYTKMTVYETDHLLYQQPNIDIVQFKNAIRNFMCVEYEFKDTGGTYKDYLDLEKMLSNNQYIIHTYLS